MKKLKFAAFLLAASATTFFTACDNEDEDPQPTKTELLTRAEWKGSDILYDGVSYKDSTGFNVAILRIKFDKAGTYTITDLDGDTDSDTWSFINNETQLIIGGDTSTISVLTNDNLNLTSTEQRPSTVPPAEEVRLVH